MTRPTRNRDWLSDITRQTEGARPAGTSAVEIEIGVRARRRRQKRIAAGVAGLLLTGVAAACAWLLAPSSGADRGRQHPVRVVCARCQLEETRQVRAGEPFPLVCRKCGERAADEVWRCLACGKTFPAVRDGRRDQACPTCGSVRVGSAAADGK